MVLIYIETAYAGLELANHFHYLVKHRTFKVRDYLQNHLEAAAGGAVGPFYLLYAIRIKVQQPGSVGAGYSVNLDALAPCNEAKDIVPEYRIAALGHLVV